MNPIKYRCTVEAENIFYVMWLLQLFKCFNHLGICTGVKAVRKNIDLLVHEADDKLQVWKKDVEEQHLVCYILL